MFKETHVHSLFRWNITLSANLSFMKCDFLTNKRYVIICDKEWHAPKYIIYITAGLCIIIGKTTIIINIIIVYCCVIIGSIGFADTWYGYSRKTHCSPMNESAYTDSYNCQDLGYFSSFVWMPEKSIKNSIKL